MFTEKDLRELLDCNAPDAVLSVFLNTDPSLGNADSYKLRLRNMLKKVRLTEDVAAVERYINMEYDWSGRGIAIFSSSKIGFFRAYPMAIPLHDRVQIGDSPVIKPLANLLDSYGGYGVALVDKQGARLFSFHLGELKEQEGMLGDSVKRIKRGASSSMVGRRGGGSTDSSAMDETIDRNMREAAEFSIDFFESNDVRRILIGGTDDNIALFRSQLPKAWQSLVVGTFSANMSASHAEIHSKAIEIGRAENKKRVQRLLDIMVTNTAKGQGAVIGIRDVLSAVSSGRIKTLICVNDYHEAGYICKSCGILTVEPAEHCEGCGESIEYVPDIVEAAIAYTLRSGGEVELIHDFPYLEGDNKIGAILRY
ncbi:MAG: hypothetical protein LLG42_09750 [Chloroflexi bacterium]|nr:hypothetical protein [Chloroflexota bacterium]